MNKRKVVFLIAFFILAGLIAFVSIKAVVKNKWAEAVTDAVKANNSYIDTLKQKEAESKISRQQIYALDDSLPDPKIWLNTKDSKCYIVMNIDTGFNLRLNFNCKEKNETYSIYGVKYNADTITVNTILNDTIVMWHCKKIKDSLANWSYYIPKLKLHRKLGTFKGAGNYWDDIPQS